MSLSLRALISSLLLLFAVPALAIDEDDLLPVDAAFALSARAIGPERIALDWTIAEGYYLYRHRISAVPADGTGQAAAIVLPRGEAHTDEFFGRVETFRGAVRGTLEQVVAPAGSIALKVKYQGCADLGICYPPQTRTVTVGLPGASQSSDSGLASLGRALTGQGAAPAPGVAATGTDAVPLPPEQAFGLEAIAGDGNTLLLRFTPAKGYYLYRDRNSFRLEGADGIATGRPG
jgi:thiol:disulfide interchange protein DsbD